MALTPRLKIFIAISEYLRQNQAKLRAESYSGLMDHVATYTAAQDFNGSLPGRIFILPSTYAGSPRNMTQNYHDAMSIVRHTGMVLYCTLKR